MSELAIEARDLLFRHIPSPRQRRRAPDAQAFELHLPHWRVPRGARVALHGPSGCGKTTLLELVAGILPVHGGVLEVEGQDLARLPEAARRAHRITQVGFVFQDYPLVEHLDLVENVVLPYRLNPALQLEPGVYARARELLAELGLRGKEHRLPRELSQGERRRAAIARALITRARLLLADEPTASLDPARGEAVVDLLEGLSREHGLTLLLVTHDPALLPRFDEVLEVWRHTRGADAAGGEARP
jgi:putative ABC transport system ATP-binding protein